MGTYALARKTLGFSQALIAQAAGCSQSAVSRLERGASCPRSAEARIRETLSRLGAPVPERSLAERAAGRLVLTPAQLRAEIFAEERRACR
jgi:transcriptional regulator with XRE-family HTH domain